VNGDTEYEGRVEICVGGQWGTVCDDLWDRIDAGVACAQLGYARRDAVAYYSAHFGQGTGSIHLDNLRCNGAELMLINCPHPPVGVHNCYHGEDAGVRCQPLGKNHFNLFPMCIKKPLFVASKVKVTFHKRYKPI